MELRTRFNEAWKAIVASKRKRNKTCLSQEEYIDLVRKVIRLKKEDRANISGDDHRFLRRFDIVIKNDRQCLVKPSSHEGVAPNFLQLYVTNQAMFDVLNEAYLNTNYRNAELLYSHIRRRYCNVTKEVVVTYLRLCVRWDNPPQVVDVRSMSPEVRAMSSEVEQGPLPMPPSSQSPVRGITSVYFGFVDMHRYARDGNTCIMVHWDTVTQYTHIVPLKNMNYKHVADNLLKIYSKVGIPDFIDAPYDIPYITSIVDYIKSVWRGGNCCIKIRHSEDQNATIEGWNAVQKVMEPWIDLDNIQRQWPTELKRIQRFVNNKDSSGKVFFFVVSEPEGEPR